MGEYFVITVLFAILTILMSAAVLLIEVFIWAIVKTTKVIIRKVKRQSAEK